MKLLTTLLFALIVTGTTAQHLPGSEPQGKNIVKFNMLPLLGGKFAFEYNKLTFTTKK